MRKSSHAIQKSFPNVGASSKFTDRTGAAADSDSMRGLTHNDGLGPDTSKWEIKDFLTFRINVLYRLLDRQLKKMLAEHHDLSIAEWRVLGQLATNSPTTVRGIAARTYMAKSQISRAAAALVRRGYALRRKDSADERSAVFAITKQGKKKYEIVMRMNRERQRRLIAELDPNERRVMFAGIDRLIRYVRGDI
jgi:DNA-binding MarR family transcriptional regulator